MQESFERKPGNHTAQQSPTGGGAFAMLIHGVIPCDGWCFPDRNPGRWCNHRCDDGFPLQKVLRERLPLPYIPGYINGEYDKLIETAFAEKNRKERSETLHKAEELLIKDMAVMPIVFNKDAYVTNDTVSKVGSYYYGFRNFTKTKVKDWRTLNSIDESIEAAKEDN